MLKELRLLTRKVVRVDLIEGMSSGVGHHSLGRQIDSGQCKGHDLGVT